jgi:hypothetical protein
MLHPYLPHSLNNLSIHLSTFHHHNLLPTSCTLVYCKGCHLPSICINVKSTTRLPFTRHPMSPSICEGTRSAATPMSSALPGSSVKYGAPSVPSSHTRGKDALRPSKWGMGMPLPKPDAVLGQDLTMLRVRIDNEQGVSGNVPNPIEGWVRKKSASYKPALKG